MTIWNFLTINDFLAIYKFLNFILFILVQKNFRSKRIIRNIGLEPYHDLSHFSMKCFNTSFYLFKSKIAIHFFHSNISKMFHTRKKSKIYFLILKLQYINALQVIVRLNYRKFIFI